MQNIFWSGYTNYDRIAAISAIENIVSQFGYIIDFKLYSDISISLVIEAVESHVDSLYEALTSCLHMNDFDRLHSGSSKERTIYLNVTFAKATGNLKNDIPAVPG